MKESCAKVALEFQGLEEGRYGSVLHYEVPPYLADEVGVGTVVIVSAKSPEDDKPVYRLGKVVGLEESMPCGLPRYPVVDTVDLGRYARYRTNLSKQSMLISQIEQCIEEGDRMKAYRAAAKANPEVRRLLEEYDSIAGSGSAS